VIKFICVLSAVRCEGAEDEDVEAFCVRIAAWASRVSLKSRASRESADTVHNQQKGKSKSKHENKAGEDRTNNNNNNNILNNHNEQSHTAFMAAHVSRTPRRCWKAQV